MIAFCALRRGVPRAAQWIDFQGWLANGAVRFWLLVCSVLALRYQVWRKGLAYLGIIGAFIYFLALAFSVVPDQVISGVSIYVGFIGAIFAPV